MPDGSRSINRSFLFVAVPIFLLGLIVVGYQLVTQPHLIPIRDFVEYYSAGVVNLKRGNPYDANQLLPVQREAAGDPELAEAMMMWNPPWMLTLVTPLGLFSPKVAHLIWLAMQLFAMVTSCVMLWRVYGGPPDKWIIGAIAGLFFGPFFILMWYGQVGTLCLLGLAGYLYGLHRGQLAIAGLFVALTAIKPHLLFAFGLVLVLDALVTRRGRIVVAFGALALALAAGIAWLLNTECYHHYFSAGWTNSGNTHTSPKDWNVPLVSYWLRQAIDPTRFGIQFVPTILTVLFAVAYWFAKRKTWNWPVEAPRLIFLSVIFTAYGAWIFDLVVLVVPVVQAAVWLTTCKKINWIIVAVHAALNGSIVVGPIVGSMLGFGSVPIHWFVFFSPVTLLVYFWAERYSRNQIEGFRIK